MDIGIHPTVVVMGVSPGRAPAQPLPAGSLVVEQFLKEVQ